MIFSKEDNFVSDEQVELFYRKCNIHYRACVGSLIFLLSERVDFCFQVHSLAKFSSNPGKLNRGVLVHLLRYIGGNNNL